MRYEELSRKQKEDVVALYNRKWASREVLKKAQSKTQTFGEKALSEMLGIKLLEKNVQYFDERSLYFPEGQLVAVENGEIKAALTTIPSILDIASLLEKQENAYNRLHEYENIYDFRNDLNKERVIYCISIIGEDAYAKMLLNEIRNIGLNIGFFVMPFSAPRSLRFYFDRKPEEWEVKKYLYTTRKMNEQEFYKWQQIKKALIEKLYHKFIKKPDNIFLTSEFFKWFYDSYGKEPTLRDVMIYFDERPIDFTLAFHMMKGANLFYFNGRPVILKNSRPEDVMAHGYNMLLIYD